MHEICDTRKFPVSGERGPLIRSLDWCTPSMGFNGKGLSPPSSRKWEGEAPFSAKASARQARRTLESPPRKMGSQKSHPPTEMEERHGRNMPVQIGRGADWKEVAAGGSHSLGLKTDGTLWAWGYNRSGQLGDGTRSRGDAPVQVGQAADWMEVAAGWNHTVGLRIDGTLWAWGATVNKDSPVQLGQSTDWVAISAGYNHTLGLKRDGTLWTWGDNSSGQLGNGTTSSKNAPVQIGQSICARGPSR